MKAKGANEPPGSGKSTPVLGIVVSIAGSLPAIILPLLVDVSSRVFALNAAAAGRVEATEMFGLAAGSVAISVLLSRATVSGLMVASLLALIIGNLLTIALGSNGLMATRFATGLGEGGAAAANAAIIAGTGASGRYFGILLCSLFVIATVMFRFHPTITAALGPYAVYWILTGLGCLALPAAWFARRTSPTPRPRLGEPASVESRRVVIAVALGLLGIIVSFAAWTTIWAYAVDIGRWSGLSSQGTDVVLSYATLAALGGSGLAVLLGPRLGNAAPLLAGGAIMGTSAMLVIVRLSQATYPLAILAWMGGIQFAAPYMVAVMSEADPRGQAASLSIAAQTLGISIGPAVAATVVNSGSAAMLASLAIVLLVPSFLLLVAVAKWVGKTDTPLLAREPH